jgi:hypothetical protein
VAAVRAALATTEQREGLDLADLERRFLVAESEWARKGSGMTKDQLTGASMVFSWLRQAAHLDEQVPG